MPARRDMLTGRLNFLHRSWGPLEPFDNAFPELLHQAGIYSHLITDHFHYFEDGGATYHTRYDSYEFVRGQEGDRWKAMVQPHWERLREMYHESQFSEQRRTYRTQNMINREFIREEKDFPSVQCFEHGLRVPRPQPRGRRLAAAARDRSTRTSRSTRPSASRRRSTPAGRARSATGRATAGSTNCRRSARSCAPTTTRWWRSATTCSASCSTISTRTICGRTPRWSLTTDHGFLLGEHDFWAKNRMNLYEEIVHIPLFAHDPRAPARRRAHRRADADRSTSRRRFLDLFGVPVPVEMEGHSILPRAGGRCRRASGASSAISAAR